MEKDISDLFKKAITHHKQGDLTKAESLYIEILKNQPSHPDANHNICLLYTSPSPRDRQKARMPSSA